MKKTEYSTTVQLSHLLATDIGISGDEATIIDALYHAKSDVTESNLADIINSLFHISVEEGRLKRAIRRLQNANKIFMDLGILRLCPNTLQEISNLIMQNEQCEKCALKKWTDEFQNRLGRTLPSAEVVIVENCIINYIKTFFLTHGADCFKFISGANQEDYFDIRTLANDAVVSISEDYKIELSCFLMDLFSSSTDSTQKSFLIAQLKKAIQYLSMVVDNGARSAINNQLDGLVLYLDTPILYRLFNLQGTQRFESISRLLDFCKKSKIALKVLQTTINEMKRRLDYDGRVIVDYPTPIDFAIIGYKSRTSENYISTFWQQQIETGISPKDFNYRYSNIGLLLDHEGIEVDTTDYIGSYNLQSIKNDLYAKVSQFSNTDPDYPKSTKAIDHDAECLASIEAIQKPNATTAIESKAIFLTTDWSLIRLQRYDYEYKTKTDLVVLPSQLMQIFCMTCPTTSYLEAFLGLFSSSKTAFGTNTLTNAQIQEIIARVAMYKGTTPIFAEKVLTSQLILTAFADQESDEDKNELIDNAIIAQVEILEKGLEVGQEEIRKALSESDNKSELINMLTERLTAIENKLDATNSNLLNRNNELDNVKEKILAYDNVFSKESERKGKRIANMRYFGGLFIIVAGSLFIVFGFFAIIPFLSAFALPCLNWIKSGTILVNESNSSIINTIVAIGVLAVPLGISCIIPGRDRLVEKYSEKIIIKMKKSLN